MAESWRRWGLPVYMVGSTGCLVSASSLNNSGYGPHRRMWEKEFGPVPEGMDLDHTCRNRWCVNTAHLEVTTRKVNLARGKQSSRVDVTLCRKGIHPWVDSNTFVDGHGKTRCLACHTEYHANYREQARARAGRGGAR